MLLRSLAAALTAALMFTSSQASAQSAAEKAQGGIGGYLAILAIGQLCKFELEKPMTEAIVANINALQPKAKMTDAELDAGLKGLVDALGKRKPSPCAGGQTEYYAMAAAMAKGAEKEAEGSGVALKPVPPRAAAAAKPAPVPAAKTAPSPKEAAKNMAIAAHMLEAISDECKIELTSKESLALDRVQYYFRGKADLTAAEVKAIVEAVEQEAKKTRAQVCAPEWGFKATLKTMLETIQ